MGNGHSESTSPGYRAERRGAGWSLGEVPAKKNPELSENTQGGNVAVGARVKVLEWSS